MPIAFVNSIVAIPGQNSTTGDAASPGASSINTTGATLLVAVMGGNHSNSASMTDSAGNTWSYGTLYFQTGLGAGCRLAYVLSPTTSTTHTFTPSATFSCEVFAFSGAGTWSLDVVAGTNLASAFTVTTPTITPSSVGEVIIAGCGDYSNYGQGTVNNGFSGGAGVTSPNALAQFLSNSPGGGLAGYLIDSSASAINATFTTTGSNWIPLIAAFELTPASVNVPNIVGSTQAVGTAALVAAGLVAGTITTTYSAIVPAGIVISESPAAGTSVLPSSAVNILVSLGPNLSFGGGGYPAISALPVSMAKGLKKTPRFDTVVQKVSAGRGNASVSLKPYPTWDFELDLDHIVGSEAQASSAIAQFLGMLMVCRGSNGLFLFADPQDSTVSYTNGGMLNVTPGGSPPHPMRSTGDGVSTQYQLARTIGGIAWDILQIVNVTGVQVNGATKSVGSDYTLNVGGVVTFAVAPPSASTLTWSGTFMYLCRFDSDSVDSVREFTVNSGTDHWSVSSVKFSSEFI
jgi:hypothetical protein